MVLEQCREVGIPIALTISGGYARDIDDTVAVHVQTARIAAGLRTAGGRGQVLGGTTNGAVRE